MPDENDDLDFEDMWSEAADAEADGTGEEFPVIETGADLLTDDELDTDVVEGETVPPVADKPEGESDEWDWSANADKLVPIKVGDVEQQIPLKELRDGYMRQQDYTQKTQQVAQMRHLAEWARDVQNGFQADPEGMLESFARAFKINVGAPKVDPLADIDEDLKPVYQMNQQMLAQLEETRAELEAMRQERVVEGVRRELDVLKGKFGEAFDPKETILIAQHYNLPLEEAHYLRVARSGTPATTPVVTPSPPAVDTAAAEATEAAVRRAEEARLAGKAAAVGTVPKGKFRASEIAVTEFNDIGELFELVSKGSN